MSEIPRKSEYSISNMACPDCDFEKANVITHLLDIPYYEDYAMININCPSCGFRTTDFFHTNPKGHIISVYTVDTPNDMVTKIVRATEGTVRIIELGIAIEPMSGTSTWIRNIEGILVDIDKKLAVALAEFDDAETQKATNERIELVKKMLNNEVSFTIEVEDPTGNSIILPANPDKVVVKFLDKEEYV